MPHMVPTCIPALYETEAEKSQVQAHPRELNNLVRPCLK